MRKLEFETDAFAFADKVCVLSSLRSMRSKRKAVCISCRDGPRPCIGPPEVSAGGRLAGKRQPRPCVCMPHPGFHQPAARTPDAGASRARCMHAWWAWWAWWHTRLCRWRRLGTPRPPRTRRACCWS